MQHIVASATEVKGPRRFAAELPRPLRRPAFFGDGALPPALEKAKNDYYRDVAVLAFPTPAGGPAIADIEEKALYVRAPYSSQPGVRPFLPAPADYPALPPAAVIETERIVDLSDRLTADGRLRWDVPEGSWTILRFGCTSTGANTRPAPLPGLGLECDKLDRAALDSHFDRFIGALLRAIGPRRARTESGWTMLHIDSWEMGAQNWTPAFREEFRRRRGYDLLPYLPAVTGRVVGSLEISERFLWDLRQTAQELVIDNHAQHLKELGRAHGFRLSIEPYDMTPCADMSPRYGGRRADGRVLALRFRHQLQRHRSREPGAHLRAARGGGRGVHLERRRTLAGASGVDEGARRLGLCRRHQSHRFPSLSTSALARCAARHDDGALRRALGAHANLVADGARLPPLPHPLPVPAPCGAAGGRRLLPGGGRRTARVSPTRFGPARRSAGPPGLQFRRLRARDAAGGHVGARMANSFCPTA